MKRKPTVEFEDTVYSCRRYNVVIPDLSAMTRIGALVWLNQNTHKRGYSTKQTAPDLAGLTLVVR